MPRGRILKEGESASASLLECRVSLGGGTNLLGRPTRSAKKEQTEDGVLDGGILFVFTAYISHPGYAQGT